jgi:hypothetical protein
MNSPTSALAEITKIGNYAIPVFGAVVTAAIALGPIGKEITKGPTIIVSFAVYTLFAAFISYLHRLSYLRCRRAQKIEGKEPTNLSKCAIIFFMGTHFLLIIALVWVLRIHCVL